MNDTELHTRIDELVAEQHTLRDRAGRGEGSSDAARSRLGEIEVELDRLWDLRRRRDAASEFGDDPQDADLRSARTVEGYEN